MRVQTNRVIQEAQELAQVWNSFTTQGEKKVGNITPSVLNTQSGDCKELLDSLTSLNAQAQAVRLQLKTKIICSGDYVATVPHSNLSHLWGMPKSAAH